MPPKQDLTLQTAWPLFLPSPADGDDKTTLASIKNMTHDDIKALMNFYELEPEASKT